MTAIGSDEVINELEAECECSREVLAAMQAQRDLARDCAAALEAENAALRVLVRAYAHSYDDVTIGDALWEFGDTGTLSADALALASRLSGGEG